MISVVTVCFNSEDTIKATLRSLYGQSHKEFQHIIIDGGSTDQTIDIIRENPWPNRIVISEHDNGIYEAFNKGLSYCDGDIVGFLNSDDKFSDYLVLSDIADTFLQTNCNISYGDLLYVSSQTNESIKRHWVSEPFDQSRIRKGWMPAHPTFYCQRNLLIEVGGFDESFRISADYKNMMKLLSLKGIRVSYIPRVLVKMRTGGESNKTIGNLLIKILEDFRIIRQLKLGGAKALFFKNIGKIPQFLVWKKIK
jgi:glycosyltransferase